ncbi:MAG: hypothetical protein ACXVJ0_00095 [Candidatus Angelobacter sp.]
MNSHARIFYTICCALSLLAVDGMSTDLATKTRLQESVRGYLVDGVCLKEEAAQLTELGPKHTKKCLQMPACRESGYALLLPSNNNDVLRFDKRGNDLAARLVNGHRLESGWLLQATGKRHGDQLDVATLELVPKSLMKRRKR